MMSSAGDGPRAEFCDHFGCVVRLTRSSRRYEITCMRTDVCSRTTKLERALELVRGRWNLRAHTDPDSAFERDICSYWRNIPKAAVAIFFGSRSPTAVMI